MIRKVFVVLFFLPGIMFSQSLEVGPIFGLSQVEGNWRGALDFDFSGGRFDKEMQIIISKKSIGKYEVNDYGVTGGLQLNLRPLNTLNPIYQWVNFRAGYGFTENPLLINTDGLILGAAYTIARDVSPTFMVYLTILYSHHFYGTIEIDQVQYDMTSGFFGVSLGFGIGL